MRILKFKHRACIILLSCTSLLFSLKSFADTTPQSVPVNGQSGSIEQPSIKKDSYFNQTDIYYFYGEGYKLATPDHSTLKFQNIATFSKGDNYFFFSIDNPDKKGTTVYGRWDPRLSFGKIFHKKIEVGPISDVLLAGEIVAGQNSRAYAEGLGFNLKVPKFAFATVNIQAFTTPSNPNALNETNYLIHPVWDLYFFLGRSKFNFTGYADFIGPLGRLLANQHVKPEFLLDLGNYWYKPNRVYTGIIIDYWHNKFGLAQTQSVVEYTLKARF